MHAKADIIDRSKSMMPAAEISSALFLAGGWCVFDSGGTNFHAIYQHASAAT